MTDSTPDSASASSSPVHVAIIMDGNGRWAKKRGLPRNAGHRKGAENVKQIIRSARKLGIKYLSLYAFSCENWRRPKEEVDELMKLLERFLKDQAAEIRKQGIRLRTIGDISVLPENVRTLLLDTMSQSAENTNGTLVLALNYGSRQEIVTAAAKFASDVNAGLAKADSLSWEQLSGYLYTTDIPDPDLIIRTSGEQRISNFLLLQGAYAELFFSDKNWPDFGRRDLEEAVQSYCARERRFGMTAEQLNNTH